VSSRYRVLRTLLTGERGHRLVRLVQDPLRREVVVLKTAPTDSAAAIALLAEGALHAGLAHPTLVPVVHRFAQESGLAPGEAPARTG
jgi:hypothetical protein